MERDAFVIQLVRMMVVLMLIMAIIAIMLAGMDWWLIKENEQLQAQRLLSAPVLPIRNEPAPSADASAQATDYFQPPDLSQLGNTPYDSMVRYGYALITETYRYLGPDAAPTMRYAGNRLSCQNCHLKGGTQAFAVPYVGVFGQFPQYRGRENKVSSLEERINGCMERSLSGRPLPYDSPEMRAMVAYMQWLSRKVPVGEKLKGMGLPDIKLPDRAADTLKGKAIYEAKCALCHGQNGEGVKNANGGYQYPPLWGPDSYNDGAGMHRVITAAKFIKANMPFGASADAPQLSDEEAYDVAAYINAWHHKRPSKKNKDKDYPNSLDRKPVSAPYGPYADTFPARQHKYGPFQPIIDFYGGKNIQ